LPFLTVLCPAKLEGQPSKACRYRSRRRRQVGKGKGCHSKKAQPKFVATGKTPRQHKTAVDLLMSMIRLAHRWLPERTLVLVVDGGYAAVKLALACQRLKKIALVMRFHWDAALYQAPKARAEGQRGPTALKGARQRSPKAWAARSDTPWTESEVEWYGGQRKKMLIFTRTALWYTPRYPPVEIRYVLTRDPEGKLRDEVFACTDTGASAEEIIKWFVLRWGLEVTFEEMREQMGMETQRQWSDLAIARTTPILMGLFSLVVIYTRKLRPDGKIPILSSAWYDKVEVTFSDCLAMVRKHLWSSGLDVKSAREADFVSLPRRQWEHLLSCLSTAA
jgi:hypothetical protein